MRKENLKIAFVTLLAGGALALGALGLSRASDTYQTDFQAQYPAAVGTRIDSCLICHNVASPGNTARNAYGAAWRSNAYSFTAIENLDSDGDGFTNKQEITALTFPGNAADLPAGDTTLPTVTSFTIPATSSSLTVPITSFGASDNVAVTGYLLTESSTKPAAADAGWTGAAWTAYTFSTAGAKTLYAWAKDGAGNVSASLSSPVTVTVPSNLYVDFGATGGGLKVWNGTAWTALTTDQLQIMAASGSSVYGDFSNYGLYMDNGTTWSLLTKSHPQKMAALGSLLYADFASYGLYSWNGTAWTKLTGSHPEDMLLLGSTLYGDFGALGLYSWNGAAWTQLTGSNPQKIAGSITTFYADFPAGGLYSWNGTTWTKLTGDHPQTMISSGGMLYGDFAAYGLYKWDGTAWTKLTTSHPSLMAASGALFYGYFGTAGFWKWDGTTWTNITTANTPESIVATGSILYADFGAAGLWKYDTGTWSQISSDNAVKMVAGYVQ